MSLRVPKLAIIATLEQLLNLSCGDVPLDVRLVLIVPLEAFDPERHTKKQAKKLSDERHARAECFILCDYARAENGKLYIIGGGWDEIVPQRLPLEYETYLAIKLILFWDVVADPTTTIVRAELLDANHRVLGDPVFETTLEGGPVDLPDELEGQGRLMVSPFMGNAARMNLTEPGLFTLRLLVNDEEIATTTFKVAPSRSHLPGVKQALERPDPQDEQRESKRETK